MIDVDDVLRAAERRPLVGWDLGYDGRIGFVAPWDFEAIVDAHAAAARSLLDMGTGGGEWLSKRPFPKGRTVATEAWAPNVPVARAKLAPLGAAVVAIEGAPDNADQAPPTRLPALPFAQGAFDLVTNRHESFVAAEVARVLADGGVFVTQQIRSDFAAPIRALLGARPPPPPAVWGLSLALEQLTAAGLVIEEAAEGEARTRFADVGALAWYLLHVPWVMPEFRLADYADRLRTLQASAPLEVPQPMFRVTARKPGNLPMSGTAGS